jgi:CxxC motif-containing protein (DUF1111 family)
MSKEATAKQARCVNRKLLLSVGVLLLAVPFVAAQAVFGTYQDPGATGGGGSKLPPPVNPPAPLPGLTSNQLNYFNAGLNVFNQLVSVSGGETNSRLGLGPRFNSNSCSSCHDQPVIGGAAPFEDSNYRNPEHSAAIDDGATNSLPSFIVDGGPTLEARFVFQSDGVTPDGGVHNLFAITGRSDATGCNLTQPDFTTAQNTSNLVFRIPISVLGDGLLEAIPDSAIATQSAYEATNPVGGVTGIHGIPNPSPNGGIFGRFGWKAQNPSMLVFTGEASDVELGVSDELVINERDETPGCDFNGIPEDQANFGKISGNNGSVAQSDNENLALFQRFTNPPTPVACPGGNQTSCTNGEQDFINVGCALCHNPGAGPSVFGTSYETAKTSVAAMSYVVPNLFSDLLVHHMGPGLADCVTQGAAAGDMFRTPPLWGLSARIFLLHDGRTTDLVTAIQDHYSDAGTAACGNGAFSYGASEANPVINNYNNNLTDTQKQDVLNFLRSL